MDKSAYAMGDHSKCTCGYNGGGGDILTILVTCILHE